VCRAVIALVAIALTVSVSGPAEARSLKIRHDPNDQPNPQADIRRVVSDLSTGAVYLRIDTWQKLRRGDQYLFVLLDSGGNRRFDRKLEIFKGEHGYRCRLRRALGVGEVLGERRAARPSARSWACSLPRSWFPRIHRAVRFYAGTLNGDRAPNRGLYHWL
jgi:hypothetical protein